MLHKDNDGDYDNDDDNTIRSQSQTSSLNYTQKRRGKTKNAWDKRRNKNNKPYCNMYVK
jgi:hypothetical protein